jgi:hypothetical protein
MLKDDKTQLGNIENLKVKYNPEGINLKMIAANCNTLLNGCAYNNTFNVLAYASSNLIYIYDTISVKSYLNLSGHKDRVNVVRWIDSSKNKVLIKYMT